MDVGRVEGLVVVLEQSIISDGRRDVWGEHIAWYATRTGLSAGMTWIRGKEEDGKSGR